MQFDDGGGAQRPLLHPHDGSLRELQTGIEVGAMHDKVKVNVAGTSMPSLSHGQFSFTHLGSNTLDVNTELKFRMRVWNLKEYGYLSLAIHVIAVILTAYLLWHVYNMYSHGDPVSFVAYLWPFAVILGVICVVIHKRPQWITQAAFGMLPAAQ